MLNLVQVIGRLGKEPELRYSANGTPVCNFSVATDDGYGENKHTEWFRVVAFGKTAEACGQYLTKGKLVYLSGRLQTRSYETKAGEKRYSTEVLADRVQFLSGKSEGPVGSFDPDVDPSDLPFDD